MWLRAARTPQSISSLLSGQCVTPAARPTPPAAQPVGRAVPVGGPGRRTARGAQHGLPARVPLAPVWGKYPIVCGCWRPVVWNRSQPGAHAPSPARGAPGARPASVVRTEERPVPGQRLLPKDGAHSGRVRPAARVVFAHGWIGAGRAGSNRWRAVASVHAPGRAQQARLGVGGLRQNELLVVLVHHSRALSESVGIVAATCRGSRMTRATISVSCGESR